MSAWQKLAKSIKGVMFAFASCGVLAADAFPTKPIRLIVPFPAGGGGDAAARSLAPPLSANLRQQVVIDNRGGAGGIIGMELVKHAVPDGYTLLLSTAGFTAMPALYKNLPFDPVKDFTGVIVAQSGMYVLVVNMGAPMKSVTSVKELIAHAKANPGKLDFASAGTGTTIHLAAELFKSMAQINMTHVPYKGAAPALTDVIAGQVQTMFAASLNASVDPGRQAARARRDIGPALDARAGVADYRGERPARIRGRRLVWSCGAGAHAARHLAEIEC